MTRLTLTPSSPDAPKDLWNVKYPPEELHIEGKPKALELLHQLPARGFAIVGSRNCQARSAKLIENVLDSLSGQNLIVVSGLARGVDAEAHLAALNAELPTIAVLGCGLDVSYPRENEDLRRRIVDRGGLVISEFPNEQKPLPWGFLRRNRLIAGWAQATWIVEASFRSGALNTASWARQQERACFATPCFPGDPSMAGNQGLLGRFEDPAKPLWGALSLAEIWLELESHLVLAGRRRVRSSKEGDPLLEEIRLRTAQRGGVAISELIGWALARQISVEEFFERLREASEDREIRIKNGVIAALKFR